MLKLTINNIYNKIQYSTIQSSDSRQIFYWLDKLDLKMFKIFKVDISYTTTLPLMTKIIILLGVCDTHLTAATGVIKSPGYPAQYSNNLDCTTKITVASGKRINLNFIAFDLESHSSCAYDYVEITNGSSSVKYCGNTLPPSVTTKTNELTIKLKTDGSVVRTGFSATYTTVDSE